MKLLKTRPWFSQICPDKEAESPHRGKSVARRKPESIQGTAWISKTLFSTILLSPVVSVFRWRKMLWLELWKVRRAKYFAVHTMDNIPKI